MHILPPAASKKRSPQPAWRPSRTRGSPSPHVARCRAGQLDRREDAKSVVQRLLELQPGLTVTTAILSARYVDPKNIAALENALRRAGLP